MSNLRTIEFSKQISFQLDKDPFSNYIEKMYEKTPMFGFVKALISSCVCG